MNALKMHKLKVSMEIPRNREEVFPFFAEADNLERITPPELKFSVISSRPLEIKQDTLIEYRLGLFGIRFSWLTQITRWDPPYEFIDEQIKGPYKIWRHTHRFKEKTGVTIMEDEVDYALPLFPLGEIAYPAVRLQLFRIFSYRQKTIKRLFI